MIPLPEIPNVPGGGMRQQRAAQLKAEMEFKQRQAKAEAAGAQLHIVQEGETLEIIAASYDRQPDTIWKHSLNEQLQESRQSAGAIEPGDALYVPEAQEHKEDAGTGPVGQGEHLVKQGECISSIAKDTGHFWETIWSDAANRELREVRRDPNLLLPGDRVTIPEITPKEESGETEQRHRFVRRGEPEVLRVRVFDEDRPRANQPYTLRVDDKTYTGTTDADGKLQHAILPNARRAELTIGPEGDTEEYELELGEIDPITEVSGIQGRLNNVGYDCGPADGRLGPRTREALEAFQLENELEPTATPDQATRAKLREAYGC